MVLPDSNADAAVVRFAPSPNGLLHLGHAYSALYSNAVAQELGGRFLLRIEDIDLVRSRSEFVAAIFEDLAWLGLVWERPVRRQSEHFAVYRRALERLKRLGVVYPCFATRKEIAAAVTADAPRDPDGSPLYPGLSRNMSMEERERCLAESVPHAWRLDMAAAFARACEVAGGELHFVEEASGPNGETGRLAATPEIWGDVIVARKDIATSYHMAVVIDDALQGVTHVTRGYDLFYATHIHRVLQVLLDLPQPRYRHHDLVRDGDARKLSKSAGSQSLAGLRKAGVSAQEILEQLGLIVPE